jgi:hypothetical protein
MNEEVYQVKQELDKALTKIRNAKAGKMTSGLEAIYGSTYQKLVRLGEAPQLKGKYRG